MTLGELRKSRELHESRRYRANVKYKRAKKGSASAAYWLFQRGKEWGLVARRQHQIKKALAQLPQISTIGGAKGIVDNAFSIAHRTGGNRVYVGSGYRPGSTTTSGNVSDHTGNDASKAARDIGYQGRDLLTGPPAPELDHAVVAIGKAFGRDYGDGKHSIVDTFYWRGYRVQIIWRTPAFGGHMGHIHVGVKRT